MPEIPEDPCAILGELRTARRKIIMGQGVQRVAVRTGDNERDVRYGPANIAALDAEIRTYEDLCAASTGGTRRRHAIIAR